MADAAVIRIKPLHYVHILDNNTNVTKVEVGPQTFTRQDHQKIVAGPEVMVMIPPRNFCVIANPVVRTADGVPSLDEHGNCRLRHGDEEIRFEQEPFPLYPGEKLFGKVSPLQVVAPNSALRLRAIRDFVEGKVKRIAGDEWLFPGPGTYLPRVEVQVVEIIRATIVKPHQALKIRARKAVADSYGNNRKAGEEWLITSADSEAYILDVNEELVGEVKLTTLTNRQYCVVLDPYDSTGKQLFGQKELRKGEVCFFLRPGEKLEAGIQNVHVLAEEEALLLRAKEEFVVNDKKHLPGDRWMIYGPTDYVPPIQVEILERRKAIPLDENEGIYVRDIQTGRVRPVIGKSYLLNPYEELWAKDLSKTIEDLLLKENPTGGARDKTRVVTLRASHNSCVQVYDYKEKKSRVVFGPDLVMLGADEHFTVLSLSGDKPKKPHVIKALALLLGPDFMTDIVTVETSDHARLSLKLSYNWYFEIEKNNVEDGQKLFQVPDFVGDACKAIASRVRTRVAAVTFDDFHKNSAKIIRTAVFGLDENQKVRNRFQFNANNLVITNIDIQSVEPVDQRTRDSLQKSVQLAIEITTKSQEATARHEAERLEQEAKGHLERQKINDEAAAESARKKLIELQAESAAVETTGQATAEAKAKAQAQFIEGEANVKQETQKAEATRIRSEASLAQTKLRQAAEIKYQTEIDNLEIGKQKELASIETQKFKDIVKAIGPDTISAIAQAGPEMQAKLLEGLGIKSLLISDGHTPINLFNTAQGLLAPAAGKSEHSSY